MNVATLALAAGVAFAVCAAALALLVRVAGRLRLIDKPGTHKTHARGVPSVGGIAIVAGLLATLALPDAHSPRVLPTVLLALLGLGVLDDLHGLSPRLRFLAQIGVGILLAKWGGALLHDFGKIDELSAEGGAIEYTHEGKLIGHLVQCAVAVRQVSAAGTYNVTWTSTPTQGAQLWIVAVQSA